MTGEEKGRPKGERPRRLCDVRDISIHRNKNSGEGGRGWGGSKGKKNEERSEKDNNKGARGKRQKAGKKNRKGIAIRRGGAGLV